MYIYIHVPCIHTNVPCIYIYIYTHTMYLHVVVAIWKLTHLETSQIYDLHVNALYTYIHICIWLKPPEGVAGLHERPQWTFGNAQCICIQ
jgi:hypothetical protein